MLVWCPRPLHILFPYTTLFRSDDPLAVFGDGPGQHAPRIRSRLRLGQREGGRPVAAGTAGQEAVLQVGRARSEEHTSELQSHSDLVCRLLLEKKTITYIITWL